MKKILFALSLVVLCGCFGKQDPAQKSVTLKVNIQTDPNSANPLKARNIQAIFVCTETFDGLTRMTADGTPQLAVAESVEISEDQLAYTFRLRASQWSNGTPVTSVDFANAWKEILSPTAASRYASDLFAIKHARSVKRGEKSVEELGIQTPDPRTLIVQLEHPVPDFLERLAFPSFFPLAPGEGVCNGPFLLDSWQQQDRILLKKNPTYWAEPRVKIDAMELYMVADDVAVQMFQKGQLDWIGSPLGLLPTDWVTSEHPLPILTTPSRGLICLWINVRDPLMQNLKVRQALSAALDRSAISKATGGFLLPTHGFAADLPPQTIADPKALLREGLAELGMNPDAPCELLYSYAGSLERNRCISQVIQEQWQQTLGITVTLNPTETALFLSQLGDHRFQVASASILPMFSDSIEFFKDYTLPDDPSNTPGWTSPAFTKLVHQMTHSPSIAERMKLSTEADLILQENAPIVPLLRLVFLSMKNPKLQGEVLTPGGFFDLSYASLQE